MRARTEDMSKAMNFCDEPMVMNYRETLNFFKKYDLFESAAQ